MMKTLYFSRVQLRRDPSMKALQALLLGNDEDKGQSQHPGHHLVWSLFADGPDRRRDFLWREMEQPEPGAFLILSARKPVDCHSLFCIDEPKLFAPVLVSGDRLRFSLRVNPVVCRFDPSRGRSVKHDVVMNALRAYSVDKRAEYRFTVMREQGFAWLERQAAKSGFAIQQNEVQIDGYQQNRIPRKGRGSEMSFSTLDFEGVLEVHDPTAFLLSIARGFGASKAYGCGLMLIRRV